jgi:hypothetical protein
MTENAGFILHAALREVEKKLACFATLLREGAENDCQEGMAIFFDEILAKVTQCRERVEES